MSRVSRRCLFVDTGAARVGDQVSRHDSCARWAQIKRIPACSLSNYNGGWTSPYLYLFWGGHIEAKVAFRSLSQQTYLIWIKIFQRNSQSITYTEEPKPYFTVMRENCVPLIAYSRGDGHIKISNKYPIINIQGETATLVCRVKSDPAPVYTWSSDSKHFRGR